MPAADAHRGADGGAMNLAVPWLAAYAVTAAALVGTWAWERWRR